MGSDAEERRRDYEIILHDVTSLFSVRDHYVREDGSVEFKIEPSAQLKRNFEWLIRTIKPKGLLAFLRTINENIVLAVGRGSAQIRFSKRTPLILLAITTLTVAVDGYYRTFQTRFIDSALLIALYTAGIMGIVGIHELGHKLASSIHGMKSSPPYFIPGIPTSLPTMGAVITSGEPPVNRDSLFDLGISGPIAGLIVSIVVALGGAVTSTPLPAAVIQQLVKEGQLRTATTPWLINAMLEVLMPLRPGYGIVLSPLVFASYFGFFITFLNLLPAWQLDGGHMARAVLGREKHRWATWLSVGVFLFLGFYLMAFIVILFSLRAPEMRPLDDVSSVSQGRKVLYALILLLAFALYALAITPIGFLTG